MKLALVVFSHLAGANAVATKRLAFAVVQASIIGFSLWWQKVHARIEYQDQVLDITPGNAVILPSGTPHWEHLTETTLVARLPIIFVSDQELPKHPLTSLPLPAVMPVADFDQALPLMMELFDMTAPLPANVQRPYHQRLRCNMIMYELLCRTLAGGFEAGLLPQERDQTPEWLLQCRDILGEEFRNPDYSISDLAAAVGKSVSLVQRRFKAVYGHSPKEWLNRHRIAIASRILTNSPERSVNYILGRCGFRSRSLFYRLFKEYQGTTPSELRQSMEE